jgi:hypothetical protein
MGKIVEEQIVVGRDSLDDLNSEVNSYIKKGYQPKDPMVISPHSDDMKNHYRYMQTMVMYTSDPAPDDLSSYVVEFIRNSGLEQFIDGITDEQWKKIWATAQDLLDDDTPQHP